jgi:hypothetical protein
MLRNDFKYLRQSVIRPNDPKDQQEDSSGKRKTKSP